MQENWRRCNSKRKNTKNDQNFSGSSLNRGLFLDFFFVYSKDGILEIKRF